MLQFAPKLTKQWIREKVSDEEIFERYLGVSVTFRSKFCSPLRKDTNPTCNFFITRGNVLWMKDHSGHFAGNCYDLVMFMYGVSFIEALEIIAKDFNLINGNIERSIIINEPIKYEQSKADIKISIKEWNDTSLNFWNKYGIKLPLLNYFKVVSVQTIWLNNQLHYTHHEADPAFAYVFSETDIKIYFPLRKNARFLCNTNILQGFNYLPESGKTLIITKSLKDVMCLYNFNVPAVAPQSETQTIIDEQFENLTNRFINIYSLYDFDLTGVRTANKMKRKYGIEPLFLTNGRFSSDNYGAKDISDLIQTMGIEQTYKRLTIEFTKKNFRSR